MFIETWTGEQLLNLKDLEHIWVSKAKGSDGSAGTCTCICAKQRSTRNIFCLYSCLDRYEREEEQRDNFDLCKFMLRLLEWAMESGDNFFSFRYLGLTGEREAPSERDGRMEWYEQFAAVKSHKEEEQHES